MKVTQTALFSLVLAAVLTASGCGGQLSYGRVERDSAMTGGSLTFVYDEQTHTATFGGEGEVVAYYPADEALGRAAGNRVGVKIYAPSEISDYSKAKLEFEGAQFTAGSFMSKVYDKTQNYFVLTPLVSENVTEFKFSVTWTQDSAAQQYIIKIADGTKFASAS